MFLIRTKIDFLHTKKQQLKNQKQTNAQLTMKANVKNLQIDKYLSFFCDLKCMDFIFFNFRFGQGFFLL